jgi:hypothetical protein
MLPAPVPDGDRLAVLARRLMTAQLALMIGSPDQRDRVERLIGGELAEDEAAVARRELDALAPLLLGG